MGPRSKGSFRSAVGWRWRVEASGIGKGADPRRQARARPAGYRCPTGASAAHPHARHEAWDVPLILPIRVAEAVNEIPLFEDQHQVSWRYRGNRQDVHTHEIDDEDACKQSDSGAEIPGVSHDSIDSIPQQPALSGL